MSSPRTIYLTHPRQDMHGVTTLPDPLQLKQRFTTDTPQSGVR